MGFENGKRTALNPFSPWRSSPGVLQRTLVDRDHIINDILAKTTRFYRGAPAKHCLLVGRRGLGKTHILSLLYYYYEKKCLSPDFEDIADTLLPVLLLEEERYSLNSLVIFLLKIFEKFSAKNPLEKKWKIPAHLSSDDDVREYCFENLKDISKEQNKKIIILCDNLEEVFKQWRERDFKILRAFLHDQQVVMLIGTAVKIFGEIIKPTQPFYEFFEIIPLVDLQNEQMMNLLKKRFIEDGLEGELEQKKGYLENKLAVIAGLTGGNPRLLVFLYDIVTKRNIFEIQGATEELLESLSEYFRNRFSDLAPQEKTILDAFAEMDGPATPKEIAAKTRIKEQSTYAHIKNLKDAGFIQPVEFARHKITRYDVTERLFRMWRQNATIHGRKKYQIFIKFLKLYYTPGELKEDFSLPEKRLNKEPDDLDARVTYWINKACIGNFGERMEGLAGKLAGESLAKYEVGETVRFIYRILEGCLEKGDQNLAEGLYLTLLKLREWHKVDAVQESIALYLRELVELRRGEAFIKAVKLAREHIEEKDLLELIKPFVYAGRYLHERDRVIFEEVFPEVREIIFDIIEKLD